MIQYSEAWQSFSLIFKNSWRVWLWKPVENFLHIVYISSGYLKHCPRSEECSTFWIMVIGPTNLFYWRKRDFRANFWKSSFWSSAKFQNILLFFINFGKEFEHMFWISDREKRSQNGVKTQTSVNGVKLTFLRKQQIWSYTTCESRIWNRSLNQNVIPFCNRKRYLFVFHLLWIKQSKHLPSMKC